VDGKISVTVKVVQTCLKMRLLSERTKIVIQFFFKKTEQKEKRQEATFDSVSTLTSTTAFLCLYSAATSPAERPPFLATVELRT
jgi:hypothetical protein